ncbi:MAG: hypothetical protein WC087_02025 [Candidatus Paceibacterota bacterium]
MQKPSRKVIGVIIITVSLMIALIGKDVMAKRSLQKVFGEVDGTEVMDNSPVKTLEQFLLEEAEKNPDKIDYTPPETFSESVLLGLLGNYEDLKNRSLNTPENLDKLTTKLAEETVAATTIPNKYSIYQLSTFPDYRKDDAKQYGNQFAKIITKYTNKLRTVDAEDDMEFIIKYSNVFGEEAEELSKISIPRSISDDHLKYINNLYKINILLVKIAQTDEDPILLSLFLNQYNQIREIQPEILSNISYYFKLNDIIFSEDESGILWGNF